MDTPNARGGFLFVFREGDPPIHDADLTPEQRDSLGLPGAQSATAVGEVTILITPDAPLTPELTLDSSHVTEEHTTDV